ncbi:TLDc domain-containing protein [Entamoeba marina]
MKTNSRNTQIQLGRMIIETLKKWSNKAEFMILFDSDLQGDGAETLSKSIINKRDIYFIHFDNNTNVFGGYVSSVITQTTGYVEDSNSFVFSLIRNGVVKKTRYLIKNDKKGYAFGLVNEKHSSILYSFGKFDNIFVYRIGRTDSFCDPNSFDYGGDANPFVNTLPDQFTVQRIIILQMN